MRMVLLKHDLPDGTGHFDWMIERSSDTPATDLLITFRVSDRIDQPGIAEFGAVRLPDHREAYLEYQGPVSGGRGNITRIATGTARSVVEGDGCIVIEGDLGRVSGVFSGTTARGAWKFNFRIP